MDPDTEASPEKESPMRLACIFDNVATMAELAKYTEPDEEVRDTVESTRIEPFLGENRVILD